MNKFIKKYNLLNYAMLVFLLHSVVFYYNVFAVNNDNKSISINDTRFDSFIDSEQDSIPNEINPIYSTQDSLSFTTKDSTIIAQQDTIRLTKPLSIHGQSFSLSQDSINTISKHDLKYIEYHSFSEILNEMTPSYSLYLGTPGMFNGLSFFGSNAVSYSFNNRPLIDNEFGNYNPEKLSTEFFENVEILYGSDAVILSDNTNGVSVNLQEIKYNTKVPYTKLWYSQDTKDLISADGIFSQNFAPNFNYTFGFRRLASNGHYENSFVDIWNIRNMIRWNPTEKINISLTEYFTNHGTGLNGGINDKTTNMDSLFKYNNPQIYYYFDKLKQRTFSHDATLSCTAILDDDTTSVISGNIFFSHNENTFQLSENLLNMTQDSSMKHKYFSQYYGGNISFEQKLLNFSLFKTGAEFYQFENDKSFLFPETTNSSFSAFVMLKMDFFNYVDVSGGIRLKSFNEQSMISIGAKAQLNLHHLGILKFDMSLSEQMPNILFTELDNEKHFLILSEYFVSSDVFNIRLGAFSRTIANPIEYQFDTLLSASQNDTKSMIGAYSMFMINPFENYFLEGSLNSTINLDKNESNYPPLYLRLKTYYRIISGRSIMNLGIEGSMITNFEGKKYMPLYRVYLENDYESGFMFDGLKVFASAKLGDTFIKVSFENLLSSGFYYVPINPVYFRNFRVSFVWSFLD